jgi:RNA polymerase sigma-70 factor (ECF subfamily)
MPKMQHTGVLQPLRRMVLLSQSAALSDSELLEHYLTSRDDAHFEALLRRHGPMVLGVCRRVLRNEEDAHDAFQSTFLVFLRKASAIVPRAMVGNWLHGVAYKTALKALAMNRQRRAKEREGRSADFGTRSQDSLRDRLELLDEALSRLPAKYRSAIVLCDLEGKTIKEAAKHLHCPCGTVASRLASGRTLLARRLARYGLTLAAVTGVPNLAWGALAPVVPKPLLSSTVKAAALVAAGKEVASVMSAKVILHTERVVKAMLIAKLKSLTPVLLAMVALGGAGVLWSYSTVKAQQKSTKATPTQIAQEQEEKPKPDKELILGTWIPVSGELNGKEIPKEQLPTKLVITKDKFTLHRAGGETEECGYSIDPEKKPKEIDVTFGDKTYPGIYELKGTTLKYVGGSLERSRPSDFDSANFTLITYERQKAEREKAQAGPYTAAAARDERPKSDKELILGTWIPVAGEKNGKEIPKETLKGNLIFTKDKFTMELNAGAVREGTYTIDPEKKPKELDLAWEGQVVDRGGTLTGIYELKGTRLKCVFTERGRPSDFDSSNAVLITYEKEKKADK